METLDLELDIPKPALKVVQTLLDNGFTAYYAGGCVRDWVMGRFHNDDIDIATNATADEIQALFSNTKAVGAAFGVVIVKVSGITFEVATFRQDGSYSDGRYPESYSATSPAEDAKRRDFTINGLFYDLEKKQVIDFVGGLDDIRAHRLRTIGASDDRFEEDRLRILRAFRFAFRFRFSIEKPLSQAIKKYAATLHPSITVERIIVELKKIFKSSHSHLKEATLALFDHSIWSVLFPALIPSSRSEFKKRIHKLNHLPKTVIFPEYLCLVLRPKHHSEVDQIVEQYKLSKQEAATMHGWLAIHEHYRMDPQFSHKIAWVKLMCYPEAVSLVQLFHCELPKKKKRQFEERVKKFLSTHMSHIERCRQKKPLLSGRFLATKGIHPGKEMGRLAKLGEKIAINKNLTSQELVYQLTTEAL